MELCTESSHINPALGRGLLLSPARLFCLCLGRPVCPSLFSPIRPVTLPQICLTALPLEDNKTCATVS